MPDNALIGSERLPGNRTYREASRFPFFPVFSFFGSFHCFFLYLFLPVKQNEPKIARVVHGTSQPSISLSFPLARVPTRRYRRVCHEQSGIVYRKYGLSWRLTSLLSQTVSKLPAHKEARGGIPGGPRL